jgi:hypothetical protein
MSKEGNINPKVFITPEEVERLYKKDTDFVVAPDGVVIDTDLHSVPELRARKRSVRAGLSLEERKQFKGGKNDI